MVASSDSFQLVSVAEACRILGVSDSTLRRLLRAGRLEAQKVRRPQGHVWLVRVPAPTMDPPATSSNRLGAADGHPPGPPALTAWMAGVLEPLMAELSLSRQQLVGQAEVIGTLRAELAAEKRAHSPVQRNLTPESPDPIPAPPSSVSWRHDARLVVLASSVLVLVVVLVAGGLVVLVPRFW